MNIMHEMYCKCLKYENIYRQVSNIRRTLIGNSIVDHSAAVGHLHSPLNTWLKYIVQRQLQAETRNI